MITIRQLKTAIRLRETTTLSWPEICGHADISPSLNKIRVLHKNVRRQHPGFSRRSNNCRRAVAIAHLSGRTIDEICAEYGVTAPYVVAAVQEHAANTNRRT